MYIPATYVSPLHRPPGIAPLDVVPETDTQRIYTTICMWWGMAVYTSCVASATSTLSMLDGRDQGQAIEADSVEHFLRCHYYYYYCYYYYCYYCYYYY